ncbi:trypsin-like serine peptidase [Belnapia moabensis]|uniref:trypsin-like serine peptidase n=1 Tax=Belnapia moabensis TaxID=365533 RepID=UPI0009FC5D0A
MPISPEARHLEDLGSGLRHLDFRNGSWFVNNDRIFDLSPVVISNNPRRYVVLEAYAEKIDATVELDFIDSINGTLLDSIAFTRGQSSDAMRTVPLAARAVRVRLRGNPGVSGRVVISRALVPLPPPDAPQQLASGLTRVSLLAAAVDPASRSIVTASRAVAMVQIAEPAGTFACTGFLISSEILATAAHCVRGLIPPDRPTGWQRTACSRIGILFDYIDTAFDDTGTHAVHCVEIAYVKDPRPIWVMTVDGQSRVTDEAREGAQVHDAADFALLRVDPKSIRLKDAADRTRLAVGSDLPSSAGGPVWLVQHPWGDVQRVAAQCEGRSLAGTPLLLHRCSSGKGTSGAPILRQDQHGDWQVVGLHVCCGDARPMHSGNIDAYRRALSAENFGVSASQIRAALEADDLSKR